MPSICLPIFDNLPFIKQQVCPPYLPAFMQEDFKQAQIFLLSYQNNPATFQTYRREIERFLQWTGKIIKKPIKALKRTEIEKYIHFSQNPPLNWIGIKKVPRFIERDGARIPHPEWRVFVVTLSKAGYRSGQQANPRDYSLSAKSLREIFTITGCFYNFLVQENYTEANLIAQIRQKSRFFHHLQGKAKVRRLSELQWHYVIETAEIMAQDSLLHERTLFIMSALYALYLRVSELTANFRWTPTMGDFFCDQEGLWWFTTVGKGNKMRHIAVSDALLQALRRYRLSRNLSALPPPGDPIPLITKQLGKGPIRSTSQIRCIVQNCFDRAMARLKQDGFKEEAEALLEATVHWLRHTGISEDVKYRPREHVRDDAGHSSSAITDRYIDIELRARHQSGKRKRIKPE
jgi:site-specific recombinase XerD